MTVAELMRELERYPPDAEVQIVNESDQQSAEIERVEYLGDGITVGVVG